MLGGDPALAVASAVGARSEAFRQDERPYCCRVALAGAGHRPRAAFVRVSAPASPAFATVSAAPPGTAFGTREVRDWRGRCEVGRADE